MPILPALDYTGIVDHSSCLCAIAVYLPEETGLRSSRIKRSYQKVIGQVNSPIMNLLVRKRMIFEQAEGTITDRPLHCHHHLRANRARCD